MPDTTIITSEKRADEHRQRVENLRATRQSFDTLILREQPGKYQIGKNTDNTLPIRMKKLTHKAFLQRILNKSELPILCGAGVSMPAPCALPSGNELRDQCVKTLLRDKIGGIFLERLLALPAYESLLPELVFQDISVARSEPVDHLMAKILSGATSNSLHEFLANTYRRIFTTNFEMCLESAGATEVIHLHGHIGAPSSLQNRLFRLGKTATHELKTFIETLSDGELLVIGYSMRDQDILEAIEIGRPRRIYFLSRDGLLPEYLMRFKGEVIYTIGDAGELFGLSFPIESGNKKPTVSIRPPDITFRAQGMINLCFRAGEYALASEIFDAYQPYLKGAVKYQIMGAMANCLRIDRQYKKARGYFHQIEAAKIYHDPSRLFILSNAYVGLGLCLMDANDGKPEEAEAYYLAALKATERFAETDKAKSLPSRSGRLGYSTILV